MFLIKRNNPNSEYIEMNPTGQNMSENPFLYPTFSSGLEFDNLSIGVTVLAGNRMEMKESYIL